jgi:hypothetical protein
VYGLSDGKWQQLFLPKPELSADGNAPASYGVGGFAIDATGKPWLSYSRWDDRIVEPIYSYDGTAWTRHSLPAIDGVGHYYAHSIAFDDRGEAWAVSGTWDGDAWSQGILLRFHDGRWRLQNWTSPFWRQRWFGLFG